MTDAAPPRRRIAVLGGGVGSMTAAFHLTSTEELRQKYEVTVYQMGWRLGGKGASGRSMTPGYGHRIEEHGLHIWMGFYYNAFKMMRAAYEEMGRPAGSPLARWDDAFKPHDLITMMELIDGKWIPWPVMYPRLTGEDDATPGEGSEFPDAWGYVQMMLQYLTDLFDAHVGEESAKAPEEKSGWFTSLEKHVAGLAASVTDALGDTLLHQALKIAQAQPGDAGLLTDAHKEQHGKLLDLLEKFLKWLSPLVEKELYTHDRTRRLWILLDMGFAMVRGILKDRLLDPKVGWEAVDDQDFRKWLMSHGMGEVAEWGAPIRAVYDLVFGYVNGIADKEHANLAAGSTARGVLRMLFGYKGAIFYKMQAGMGDTVFTPFYEVLRKRGVRFEFFHRVRELVPTEDGSYVGKVVVGRQATVKPEVVARHGGYQPLVPVLDLPCWPSVPDFSQLVEGDTLQARGINLESYWADWDDVETRVLELGKDFDIVVLGISLGALPYICPKLSAVNPAFRKMVETVGTVQTQAFQLWLKPDVDQLGWHQSERAVLGAYVEPLDTWADMSQLLPREDWPEADAPKNVAYFCGPMPDLPGPHPFSDHGFPQVAYDAVYQQAKAFVDTSIGTLWPNATTKASPNGLDYELLVDPSGSRGEGRFESQFFRANIDPTELYVLSVAGSTSARLAGDDSGFLNLTLAGDWNHNGLNVGCVEAAVMGGMQAARPYVPGLRIVGLDEAPKGESGGE